MSENDEFEIFLSHSCKRDLKKIPTENAINALKDVKNYLTDQPYSLGKSRVKKLKDFDPPLYRLRSGDFRVYYGIIQQKIVLLAITDKKDSEKILKKLKKRKDK